MKEREFQAWIIKTAQLYSWRVWHTPAPMRPLPGGKFVPDKRGAGLPDLIMIHRDPPRLIFAEVKVDAPLSEKQVEFFQLAKAVADVPREDWDVDYPRLVGVYTWRAGNEAMIEAILSGQVVLS